MYFSCEFVGVLLQTPVRSDERRNIVFRTRTCQLECMRMVVGQLGRPDEPERQVNHDFLGPINESWKKLNPRMACLRVAGMCRGTCSTHGIRRNCYIRINDS